mmetsp:Transcript_44962/g.94178  ORF Transcript_44962/g.94178 Transcript_44962/m.94178 type:complete len:148 (-) Transcript_44962:118-561(-)
MDQRLKKLEDKMSGREMTDEEKLKFRKEEKELRAQIKKEKKELKAAAKQSLDPSHWTKAILNGESKFSAKIEENLEDKLSKQSVGLMTYEALKAKKEALEAAEEASKNMTVEQKRKADDDARKERDLKKVKVEKVKGKLSFNPDGDE